ncbi:MAG TPA: AMP-binding protein, partial [Thermodesulfobacteriota bacterium]|nr:AMP-binding protein [Thermodesulfobacteriota bacterium]
GQAESPMTITGLAHRDHVLDGTSARMRRLASAGTARTDVEVRIFDEEDRELPPNGIGEIVTRSDLVMKGYWRDPAATAETLRNGWLHTGDVGFMDDDGYVFILDRSKDMIVSGGENIYPREIEDAILRHPSVREVAVIGVPDREWGESVKAIVVPAPGTAVTEQELIAFCKDHLASYKKPRSVEFADVLPKNSNGKVLKRELKEKYWAGRERRV